MKPLTIEELKELKVDDWVWIILLDKMFRLKVETEDTGEGYYQKCNNRRKDAYVTFHLNFYYKDYGTKWLAYKNKEQAECKGKGIEIWEKGQRRMTDREKIYELSEAICKGCKTRHECDTENCAMSEIVAEYLFKNDYRKMDEVRKETTKDILQMIDENKFNIGKALYNQSIDDDCDAVSPYGLKEDIARKYGVKIDE